MDKISVSKWVAAQCRVKASAPAKSGQTRKCTATGAFLASYQLQVAAPPLSLHLPGQSVRWSGGERKPKKAPTALQDQRVATARRSLLATRERVVQRAERGSESEPERNPGRNPGRALSSRTSENTQYLCTSVQLGGSAKKIYKRNTVKRNIYKKKVN